MTTRTRYVMCPDFESMGCKLSHLFALGIIIREITEKWTGFGWEVSSFKDIDSFFSCWLDECHSAGYADPATYNWWHTGEKQNVLAKLYDSRESYQSFIIGLLAFLKRHEDKDYIWIGDYPSFDVGSIHTIAASHNYNYAKLCKGGWPRDVLDIQSILATLSITHLAPRLLAPMPDNLTEKEAEEWKNEHEGITASINEGGSQEKMMNELGIVQHKGNHDPIEDVKSILNTYVNIQNWMCSQRQVCSKLNCGADESPSQPSTDEKETEFEVRPEEDAGKSERCASVVME